MDTNSPTSSIRKLGWVQEQMLLSILDAYRASEARNDSEEAERLTAQGIPYLPRTFVHAPGHADPDAVLSHAARRLEDREFIARTALRRAGRKVPERWVRLLPAGRTHADALAILREVSPGELAGPIQKPRQPDPTTETGPLWHGLKPELAAQAQKLLATLPPSDTLALGMLLVRESLARGAGDETHRATFSVQEVAALVKVSPALIQLEIEAGTLHAARIGRLYRILPQDLQVWLDRERPDRRRRDHE